MPTNQESLPEFVLRTFDAKTFEDIDANRKNYCFDCMVVNPQRQELRINHCSHADSSQCAINF